MDSIKIHIDEKDGENFECLQQSLGRHLKDISQYNSTFKKNGWDVELKVRTENLLKILLILDDDTYIEEINLNGETIAIEDGIDVAADKCAS
jgi:hypothetical protein